MQESGKSRQQAWAVFELHGITIQMTVLLCLFSFHFVVPKCLHFLKILKYFLVKVVLQQDLLYISFWQVFPGH
jgi:hypothetical protein